MKASTLLSNSVGSFEFHRHEFLMAIAVTDIFFVVKIPIDHMWCFNSIALKLSIIDFNSIQVLLEYLIFA